MGKAYVLRCPACHDETEVIQGIGNRDGNNEAFFSRISDFKNEIRRRMKAGESLEEISKTIQIHHMPSAHGDRLTDAERLKALTFLIEKDADLDRKEINGVDEKGESWGWNRKPFYCPKCHKIEECIWFRFISKDKKETYEPTFLCEKCGGPMVLLEEYKGDILCAKCGAKLEKDYSSIQYWGE
jgi:predicted nucleic acid-binding Zn ribbon protein